jgi:hypothetical protein
MASVSFAGETARHFVVPDPLRRKTADYLKVTVSVRTTSAPDEEVRSRMPRIPCYSLTPAEARVRPRADIRYGVTSYQPFQPPSSQPPPSQPPAPQRAPLQPPQQQQGRGGGGGGGTQARHPQPPPQPALSQPPPPQRPPPPPHGPSPQAPAATNEGPRRKPPASALVEAAASVTAAVSTAAILRNFSNMRRLPRFIWLFRSEPALELVSANSDVSILETPGDLCPYTRKSVSPDTVSPRTVVPRPAAAQDE